MIKHKDHFHGSDLEKIEEIYGIKKEEIVSFSANVNPLGVSPLLRTTLADKIDAITTYPDREYTSLRKCIAAYDFSLYELGLYLDTHPDDTKAMQALEQYRRRREERVQEYERCFGPYIVTQNDVAGSRWSWVDDPWPWDNVKEEC